MTQNRHKQNVQGWTCPLALAHPVYQEQCCNSTITEQTYLIKGYSSLNQYKAKKKKQKKHNDHNLSTEYRVFVITVNQFKHKINYNKKHGFQRQNYSFLHKKLRV